MLPLVYSDDILFVRDGKIIPYRNQRHRGINLLHLFNHPLSIYLFVFFIQFMNFVQYHIFSDSDAFIKLKFMLLLDYIFTLK